MKNDLCLLIITTLRKDVCLYFWINKGSWVRGALFNKGIIFQKEAVFALMGLFTSDANVFDADDACGVME